MVDENTPQQDQVLDQESGLDASESAGAIPGEKQTQTDGRKKKAADHAKKAEVERRGFWRAIVDFFRRLFGRGAPAGSTLSEGPEKEQESEKLDFADGEPGQGDANDPTNTLGLGGPGRETSAALAAQTAEHINSQYQSVIAEQARNIHLSHSRMLQDMQMLGSAGAGAMLAPGAIEAARNLMQSRLSEIKDGLAGIQSTNMERQSELAKLESTLDSPDAFEAFDHASTLADQQLDQHVRGVESVLKDGLERFSQFEHLVGSLSRTNTYEHETLDPDNPSHPDYPARQAAIEEFQQAVLSNPEGAFDQTANTLEVSGQLQEAQQLMDDMDIPQSGNMPGR